MSGTSEYRGPEDQWEQRNSRNRGPVEHWAQRTRETVPTEDQWVKGPVGTVDLRNSG